MRVKQNPAQLELPWDAPAPVADAMDDFERWLEELPRSRRLPPCVVVTHKETEQIWSKFLC